MKYRIQTHDTAGIEPFFVQQKYWWQPEKKWRFKVGYWNTREEAQEVIDRGCIKKSGMNGIIFGELADAIRQRPPQQYQSISQLNRFD